MKDYHINILYVPEDRGFIAEIPELKCCSAFGETPVDALEELEKVKQLWLQTAKNENVPIPEPTINPVNHQVGVPQVV